MRIVISYMFNHIKPVSFDNCNHVLPKTAFLSPLGLREGEEQVAERLLALALARLNGCLVSLLSGKIFEITDFGGLQRILTWVDSSVDRFWITRFGTRCSKFKCNEMNDIY